MKVKNFLKRFKGLIIIIIACLVALANYLLYPVFIKKDMQLIEVPIAKTTISQGTLITNEMVATILTNKDVIPENIIFAKEDIVGKYAKANYTLAANSFFYNEMVANEKEALGTVYYKLEEGEIAYTLFVDEKFNVDSKFKVGQYIDLYYRGLVPSEAGASYLIGKLASNVKIINIVEDDSKTYLTLAVSEKNLAYYVVAEELGTVIPIIDFEANGIFKQKEIYDENSLKEYLEGESSILLLPVTDENGISENIDSGAIDNPGGDGGNQ